MKKTEYLLTGILVWSLCSLCIAVERHVPSEYGTIQDAINASSTGDEVIVADGCYTGLGNKNLDFGGRAIVVRSANGPEVCIIDCENEDRAFAFINNEDGNSVLDGFTIRNGNTSRGTPYSRCGAAIYCIDSSPLINNCVFMTNIAEDYPNAHAGAIFCSGSELQIKDCVFIDNSCPGLSANGGAILASGSQIFVFNCLFAGNSSDGGGGAIRNYHSSATAINCTFVYNTGNGRYGGAIANTPESSLVIENCIFWGNEGYEIYNSMSSNTLVINCDIDGDWDGSGIRNNSGGSTTDGGGNINLNPEFVTGPKGDYYLSQIAAGQVLDSPCVDAGSAMAVALDLAMCSTRTDEMPDVDVVDIGYHYQAFVGNLIGLEIKGPDEVAEQSQTQYRAIAVYDNNSTKDVTDLADWAVYPDTFAQMTEAGLLETELLVMPTEQVTVYVEYSEADTTVAAEKDVGIYTLCPKGNALEFDGVNDFVNMGNKSSLEPVSFTIAAWVKPQNISAVQQIAGKYGHAPRGNCAYGYRIAIQDNGKIGLYVDPANCENTNPLESVTSLQTGGWYFIAGTYDGSIARVYVNGELEAEGARVMDDYYTNFYIGTSYSDYHVSYWDIFAGIIDEVTVFSEALSAEQIQTLMQTKPQPSTPNLVGYWSFDEGQGQVACDSSNNGNDGYLGTDPCDVDDADPNWVESDVPYIRCTREQMIERNLYGALEDKTEAAEKIDSALAKENATKYMLWQMCWERDYQLWHPGQIWRAVTYILHSMIKEENCKKDLAKSERDLERAVEVLELDE